MKKGGEKHSFYWKQIALLMLFCILIYFPSFHKLERLPIMIWDESLFSLRAYYMHLTGAYMHNFNLFEGMPNHINTKLPFTSFFQVIAIKALGLNELAIRLPTVLIFIATAFYIVIHFRTRFNSILSGYVFGLVAVSSTGFVGLHMLRTGNQDVPFACYMLLAAIAFLQYMETQKAKPLICFVVFSLTALLTKNLLAGLLAPGIMLYAICTRQLIPILKDYRFWMACSVIIGVYAATIFYYETQFPGFVNRMWNYELLGRYTQVIENHDKPPLFYFKLLAIQNFIPYFFIMPIVFSTAFRPSLSKKLKHSILYFSAISLCYISILSFSKTQTSWYIAPIYLMGAYLMALGSVILFEYLRNQNRSYRIKLSAGLLLGWLTIYSIVLSNIFKSQPKLKDEKYGWFMEVLAEEQPNLKTYTLVDNNFGTSAGIYKEMYNQKNLGYDISFQRYLNFEDNQIIMTCLNNVINPTAEQYNIEVIKNWQDCKLLQIKSRKNPRGE